MTLKRIGQTVMVAACLGIGGGLQMASAQFNTVNEAGQVVPAPKQTVEAADPNVQTVFRGDYQNAGMVDTGAVEGAKLSSMDWQNSDSLGQATYHPDGSYTEFKRLDFDTPTLAQFTKSPTGVLLWKRMISFDSSKKPVEVMIYDHSDRLRFRGILNYNRAGQFTQEVIFDTEGQVIRSKTQDYDGFGHPTKFRVVEDLKKVPEDFQLVISPAISGQDARVDSRGILAGGTPRVEDANQRTNSGTTASPEAPRKKGWLGKIFSKE